MEQVTERFKEAEEELRKAADALSQAKEASLVHLKDESAETMIALCGKVKRMLKTSTRAQE